MYVVRIITKLRLVETQLPEKYREKFDVSSEALRREAEYQLPEEGPSLETLNFSLYFQVVASLPTEKFKHIYYFVFLFCSTVWSV
jgi:hypothetical protein